MPKRARGVEVVILQRLVWLVSVVLTDKEVVAVFEHLDELMKIRGALVCLLQVRAIKLARLDVRKFADGTIGRGPDEALWFIFRGELVAVTSWILEHGNLRGSELLKGFAGVPLGSLMEVLQIESRGKTGLVVKDGPDGLRGEVAHVQASVDSVGAGLVCKIRQDDEKIVNHGVCCKEPLDFVHADSPWYTGFFPLSGRLIAFGLVSKLLSVDLGRWGQALTFKFAGVVSAIGESLDSVVGLARTSVLGARCSSGKHRRQDCENGVF